MVFKEMKETTRFIIKVTILTVLSLVAAKATAAVIPSTESDIDKRVFPIVVEYVELLKASGVEIPFQYKIQVVVKKEVLAEGAVGMAFGMFADSVVMVALDPDIFYLSRNQMRWVIFHELTHDIFNIRHESGLFLMRPVLPEYVTDYDVQSGMCELADYLSVI